MKLLSGTIISLLSAILFAGCGGGGNTKSGSATDVAAGGYIIDAPIAGLDYACGQTRGVTDDKGRFNCKTVPVTFKVGNYTIGSISTMTADKIVYPQDLLGLSRDDETNTTLIALVQFFQALDDDSNITEKITIPGTTREKFASLNAHRPGTKGSGNAVSLKDAATYAGGKMPDPEAAMKHLKKSMHPEADKPADTRDKSPYMGTWAGSGWNWEIRFKQSAGKFISDTFGTQASHTIEQDKIIMSLMVEQKNKFTFDVDENGKITGKGVITYNLIPNLCGLNAIATQVGNTLDLFYGLSLTVSSASIEAFVSDSVNFDTWLFNIVNNRSDTVTDVLQTLDSDIVNKMLKKEKYMLTDSDNSQKVCRVAAGLASVGGGESIGPKTIQELQDYARFTVAKALTLDIANPLNFMLSVPGVTQVQYYYKGLQNGPESRKYTLSGYIDDNGKMFLQMDGIEGSDKLTVEYMVNYKKETPTFPVWSPFLKNPATVYPANHPVPLYKYVTTEKEEHYTDIHGNKQSVKIPVKHLESEIKTFPQPMASFKESGSHRNDVSVWHEYEYSWKAYRLPANQ